MNKPNARKREVINTHSYSLVSSVQIHKAFVLQITPDSISVSYGLLHFLLTFSILHLHGLWMAKEDRMIVSLYSTEEKNIFLQLIVTLLSFCFYTKITEIGTQTVQKKTCSFVSWFTTMYLKICTLIVYTGCIYITLDIMYSDNCLIQHKYVRKIIFKYGKNVWSMSCSQFSLSTLALSSIIANN